MKRKFTIIMILPLYFSLLVIGLGCAAKKPVVGTANTFDSESYLVLVTADATIKATKDDLVNNVFAPDLVEDVKAALNRLIDAYDHAQPIYLAYHNAALQGSATQQQQDAVAAALPDINTGVASLSGLVKVKK
jgi:hypothetical protein